MVRSMEGQGFRITRRPPPSGPTDTPSFVTTSGTTPKKGSVAVPGVVGVAPGKGVIMMAPVSVCHQVSTMGQRSPPMTLWYHIQASGLMGSPTVPRRRREDMSRALGCSSPHFMNVRMAVGAV